MDAESLLAISAAPKPFQRKQNRSALQVIQTASRAEHQYHNAKRNQHKATTEPQLEQQPTSSNSRYLTRMANKSRTQKESSSLVAQTKWDSLGASELKQALVDTTMVDAAWLAALADAHEILPRCQDVPDAAKVRLDEMEAWSNDDAETVGALIVSYPWLDVHHPDPHGEQLQRMAFVFRAFAGSAQTRRGCRVGVFIDYCALPQKRHDGHDDRTSEEHARFKRALRGINFWYGHRSTHVLLVNTPLPRAHAYANAQPYNGRGWCYAECLMSAIVKERTALLELSRLRGDEWPAEALPAAGASQRQPPLAPDVFRRALKSGLWSGEIKFTHRGDIDVVSSIYSRAFLTEMSKAAHLTYSGLGWADAQLGALSTALVYAHAHGALERLAALDLHGNELGDDGCVALADAAAPRRHCLLACLPSAERGQPLDLLEVLHLHGNRIGDAGLHALVAAAMRGAFPRLEELTVTDNRISDFGPLADAIAGGAFPALERALLADNPGSAEAVRRALRSRKEARDNQ